MASTAAAAPTLNSKGANLYAFTLTLEAGDTGPTAFEHELPFTPTLAFLRPVSGIGTAYPGIAVAFTATLCTVTKVANSAGVYTLYLGRAPNTPIER